MRYCIRFWYAWPESLHERCRLLNAGGGWRHGVIHHDDGITLRESVSLKALLAAAEEKRAELDAQGIAYDWAAFWSED